MPTASAGGISGGAPPLPPSPMTPDHALSLRPRWPGALPWYTPALTGAAGALAGVLWWEAYARLAHPSSILVLAVASALVGLGSCVADRAARSEPRALRWALGMAAIVLVGWAYLAAQSLVAARLPSATLGRAALGLIRPSLVLLVASTLPGLLFGLLAGERRRRWLMPLGGLCLLWVVSRLAIGLDLEPLNHGYCELLVLGSGGSNAWVASCATLSDGLWGLFLGLALAIGDYCAARRQEALGRA